MSDEFLLSLRVIRCMICLSASELHFLAGRLGNTLEFGIILPIPSEEIQIREKQVRGGDFG